MIWLVVAMVALAFRAKAALITENEKSQFDLSIITKVMQRQMVQGLMKAAHSQE